MGFICLVNEFKFMLFSIRHFRIKAVNTMQFSQQLVSHRCDTSCWRIARRNMLPLQLVLQHFSCAQRCTKKSVLLFATIAATFNSVTPLQQLVSRCFVISANQNPYYPLLGPPRSQFRELLAVPLHSVTTLFVQLQCYAFKRCETSCIKYCLV